MGADNPVDAKRRNRRLKVIYDTNMKTAWAAGNWAQSQRLQNAGVDIYFEYIMTTSERRRPEHLSWVGTVLPMNHKFWNKAYPPNGWGCKCKVKQHTKLDLLDNGLQVTKAPTLETYDWFNKHTGKTQKVTKGIDPAFDYNVGFSADKNLRAFEATKWDKTSKPLRDSMLQTVFDNALFTTFINRKRKNLQYPSDKRLPSEVDANNYDYMPVGYVGADIQKQTNIETGLLYMSGATAGKQKIRHPDLQPKDYAIVQEILDRGSIGVASKKDHYIGFINKNGQWWRAVWKTIGTDELWFVSFTKSQPEQLDSLQIKEWIRK